MTIETYADFDLLILPHGEGYQARVIQSPVGEAQAYFDLHFSTADLRRLTWLPSRAKRHLRLVEGVAEPPMSARAFGSQLYAAVFDGAIGQCLVRCLDVTRAARQGLRIRLRLNDVPELADLPWEYLFATGPHEGFLALSDFTPVVRYLELPQARDVLPVTPPLRILAVVADPQDLPRLEVEQEWQLLCAALEPLQNRHLLHLERMERPTLRALQDRLRQPMRDIHILHFIGHGAYEPVQAEGGIYLEDDDHNHNFVVADDLATLLHDHPPLRFVFLNACEGARSSDEHLFAGTAQTLVWRGIPAVLAMQFPIGDAAATALTHEFYQVLATGLPIEVAIGEARKAISVAGNEWEWGTPVLFTRAAVGPFVDPGLSAPDKDPVTTGPTMTGTQDAGTTRPRASDPVPIQPSALRKSMVQTFSPDELRLMCVDLAEVMAAANVSGELILDLDWDALPGSSRESKIDALIRYLQRRQLLEYLVEYVRRERPGSF